MDIEVSKMEEKVLSIILGSNKALTYEEIYDNLDDEEKDSLAKEILPPADAVIDPKRAEGHCDFKEICGAVVAYKFLQMMARISGRSKEQEFKDFFDEMLVFAGLATVCDVMELRDENRERHEKSGIEKVAVADGGRGITDGAGVGCEGGAHRRTPRLVVLHRLPRKGRGGRRDTAGAGAAPQEPGHRRRGGAPPSSASTVRPCSDNIIIH